MDLIITTVRPDDDASLQAWRRPYQASVQHDIPEFPPVTPHMLRLAAAHEFPGRRTVRLLARVGAEPAGVAEIAYSLRENLANALVFIQVDPAWRRRGIGTELYRRAMDDLRESGRTRVQSITLWDLPELGLSGSDPAGPAFARRMGLEPALPEVQRRLRIADLDDAEQAARLADAERHSTDYRLVQWTDDTPEQYLADLAYLDGRLLEDAPMGDLEMEAEQIDAERFLETERSLAARDRARFHTGAVHEPSGRMVAWTLVTNDAELPWHAWQQITIVDPGHRGHRLGMRVKLANLAHLRAHRPSIEAVDTFNAHENGHMVSINEQMGFRPLYGMQNWQRRLD